MTDPIDQIRHLLNIHDPRSLSIVMLNGTIETPTTFADSGDRALVVVGPQDKFDVVRREDKATGRITYTITLTEMATRR